MAILDKTHICIVITTFNRKQNLRNLLFQIKNQELPENVSTSVTVTIDGSTDGTAKMLEEDFPDTDIVNGNGNWWFTKSLNEAIKTSKKYKPDFYLTLNDDMEIDPNFISALYNSNRKMGVNCLVGAVSLATKKGTYVRFSGVNKIIRWRLKYYNYIPSSLLIENPEELKGTFPSLTLITRGLLIPTKIMEEVGYFDEKFPQYGSDEDFCFRAIENGYRAYISWDAKCIDNEKLTGLGMPANNPPFLVYLKSFFLIYSPNYIIKSLRFYWKYGYKVLLPIYFFILIIGSFKAYLFNYRTKL